MPASIDTVSPGRGRAGDEATINGLGFSPTAGQNVVTFDGIPTGVNLDSATQLSIVIPLGLSVDQHVPVVVTNLDDATSATTYWWSKDTTTNTAAMLLRTKIPWSEEKLRGLGRLVKNMNVAESRFFERLATKIELIGDLLASKGDFFSRSGAALGLRQALAGTAGQPFVSGVGTAGGQFQDRRCQTLQWGCTLDMILGELIRFGVAGGSDNDQEQGGQSIEEVALFTGQIALVSLRERSSATSRINRLEILVDDVVEFDVSTAAGTFPGLGIRNGESETFYPGVNVTQGQLIKTRFSRNNNTTDCFVLAYALVV